MILPAAAPRINGRKYEVASTNPDSLLGWQDPTDEQLAELTYVPIPVEKMGHIQGFGYNASMDFGEEGDKAGAGASQLLVFEDRELLGPISPLHAAIHDDDAWQLIRDAQGNATAAELTHGLIAKMGPKPISTWGYMGNRRHPMLLADGDDVVDKPVQDQPGWEI